MYFYNCPFFQNEYRFAVQEEDIIQQPDIFGVPDVMGEEEGILEHQGLPSQQQGIQGQQGMPSQQQSMHVQQGMPSQQQGMQGQQGMPSQQQGMHVQQGMPSQQQGMQGQQGMPSQQQGIQGQQGMPSQQQGMQGQQGMPSQQQGMQGQQGIPSQQQGTSMAQQDITSAELGEYTYPGNLNTAIGLIRNAVSGEREDELFYNYLISVAPTQEARNIIITIRNDERKHNRMFRRIYFELTGRRLPISTESEFEKPTSYCDGIKKALLGELAAVQRYRRIVFALQNRIQLNMLGEIITDELRHASLYNLLYSDGRCFNSRVRF